MTYFILKKQLLRCLTLKRLQSSTRLVSLSIIYIYKRRILHEKQQERQVTNISFKVTNINVSTSENTNQRVTRIATLQCSPTNLVFSIEMMKSKKRFQSCFVPRRIFLNLKRGKKNKPALESPAPFNSK